MAEYISRHTGTEIDAGIDAAKAALPKNGGAMTGDLILMGNPITDNSAVNKKYVDDIVSNISLTPGADGKSAYDIAKEEGFEGTVEEWLTSLKGEPGIQGEKGEKGETGATGPAGADGAKGDTGPQGPKGDQGEDGAPGPKGDTGEQGPAGPVGPAGKYYIPNLSAAGILSFDSSVEGDESIMFNTPLIGPKGNDGESVTIENATQSTADGGANVVEFSDGTKLTVYNGRKGSDGAPGETGPEGPQGPAGADGAKGDTGATGPQGNPGEAGQRGTGILKVTTAPTSYTTATGGKTPIKRMSISTIKTQAGVEEVLVGDLISHSYYHYHIYYLDATYAYMDVSQSIRGATGGAGAAGADGVDGKTAYQYAQDGGYTGTETEFAKKLANEYSPNPLYGKKVSFLGDSICAGANTAISYLGGYGKIIADRNNMVYENLAAGGATITAETYSDSTGNPLTWLCRLVENMSADADYAIVEGGINDGWEYIDGKITIGEITEGYNAELDDTTFYGAFESMLKQLVTKYQGKKVGYIAIPKTSMWLYDSSRNAPNFYHIALECCAKWGVPVCDLNTITPPSVCLSEVYMGDAAHPTYEGYLKYYCDPIEAWMKTLTTGGNTALADIRAYAMMKSDVSIKKAQLTLEDGTTVLIDVVVASAGTELQKYINQVPLSTDENGNIFNVGGYQKDYRLSSSGAMKAQTNSVVTGFIPAKAGDVVRISGCGWHHANATNYLCAYKADHSFVGAVTSNLGTYSTQIHSDITITGELSTVTLANVSDIAYIRVSAVPDGNCDYCNATILGADMIVTINEEIT